MPKKVLLINPPSGLYRRDDRCQSRVEDQTVRVIFPPVDLALLSAIARNEGWEVKIGDYPTLDCDISDFENDIKYFQSDILLLNVTTATIEKDLEICKIAKSYLPNITTIAKGDYLNEFWYETLQSHPELDICIHLEPEWTFRDILRDPEYKNILGISYKLDGKPIRNPDRDFIENLDELPLPARDLLNNELYRSPETERKITIINANRGCPAQCVFCPVRKIAGSKIRLRSPKNIVAEIKECVDKYNIIDFLFNGDTFTWDKDWVIDLCKEIINTNLKIRWGCNSRVDTIDKERLEWMKRAGCWVLAFGVESGDEEILKKMKKGITIDKIKNAIKVCKEVGIRTHSFYVIGLPWETKESLQKTFSLAKELDTDFFDFNIAYPLPGTELYRIVEGENLFEERDLSTTSYARAAIKTYTLSNQELNKVRRKILLKLYLRPKYIFRTIKNTDSFPVLINYLKAAIRRLFYLLK